MTKVLELFRFFLPAVALVVFLSLAAPVGAEAAGAATPLTEQTLHEALRNVLRDHPEIVLDVLREHSIDVLEIAQKGSQERQFKAMRAQWQEDMKKQFAISYDRPILGNPAAPVTIVAYSDYTCPYCADAAETIHQVMAARKNAVRFIFKNYPRRDQPLARLASEYVAAAFVLDEEKGWAYHDVVFANQMRLLKEGEGFLRAEALTLGYNLQKLGAEAKGRKVKSIIDEDITEALDNGVPGTPFHLVNNLSVRGGLPLAAFLEAVDTALAAKQGKKK
ncbi:DSBA oxidoreductase [uncultured delta proteobacterium]|uniref:DSBA oxidoreductase n=1 Tax=uncultured delta proteobacterium TaxID=34034 RepID=A0A212KAY8_9DELT|nr:DSBA oxidoreductase [uncultured delta proteobacterium]